MTRRKGMDTISAFIDELEKISAAKETAKLVGWKAPALLAAGAGLYHGGKTGVRRYRLGSQLEKQMREHRRQ